MARHGLSDEEWAVISDCFPEPQSDGASADAAASSDGRHLLDSEVGRTVARCAGRIGAVANGLSSLQSLVVGRHVGSGVRSAEEFFQRSRTF